MATNLKEPAADTGNRGERPVLEARGQAMGTSFHLAVSGGPADLLSQLQARLIQLEARWSRFLETSEIRQLNAKPEAWHLVSADTALLVDRACQGWALTGGVFDPTVLTTIEALGYRDDFHAMPERVSTSKTEPAKGCAEIVVDQSIGLVRLGQNTRIDPGGIGKGLAADLLVAEAMEAGAEAALANLGGDLACRTSHGDQEPWLILIHEPMAQPEQLVHPEPMAHPEQLATIALRNGAVATSTIKKRHWASDHGESHHHVVDPRLGASTAGAIQATVVSGEGWWAEVAAKQLLVLGPKMDQSAVFDTTVAAAIVIDGEGQRKHLGPIESFLR